MRQKLPKLLKKYKENRKKMSTKVMIINHHNSFKEKLSLACVLVSILLDMRIIRVSSSAKIMALFNFCIFILHGQIVQYVLLRFFLYL